MVEATLFQKLEGLIGASPLNSKARTLTTILADLGTPSLSMAMLDEGQTSRFSLSNNDPYANTDTLYQACSISKPIACLTVIKLVEQGILRIDANIVDLLPNEIIAILAPTHSKKHLLELITIQHLLSHTAGLNVGGYIGYPPDTYQPTLVEILEGKKSNSPRLCINSIPGLNFSYAGGGYTLLQIILETVTNKPFASIVSQTIFEPLGMTRSFYKLPEDEHNIAIAHQTGYTRTSAKWHTLVEQAAAGIWTTPTDLLKVINAIQDSLNSRDDDVDNPPFIPKHLAQQMLTSIAPAPGMGEIALSWFVDPTTFSHSGYDDPGYACFVFGFTDLSWNQKGPGSDRRGDTDKVQGRSFPNSGVCIMTNSRIGGVAIGKVMSALLYLKGWVDFLNPMPSWINVFIPFADRAAKIDGRWVEWSGSWDNGWVIEQDEDGKAVARRTGKVSFTLETGAIPPKKYSQGLSIDLVLDGMEMMMRLGWEGEERVVELWNGLTVQRSTLKCANK